MSPAIGVFVEGHRLGGVEVLLDITVADIEEVRLIQPTESDVVIGGGHELDAIINIVLRNRGRGVR
jgi:hypothetical protein